jgi:hypothetical protein
LSRQLKDSGSHQQQNREYRTLCLHAASTAARTLGTPQPLSCAVLILTSVILCDSFKFEKRGQPFIRSHNETLSVIAVRVCNPDCAPVRASCGAPALILPQLS